MAAYKSERGSIGKLEGENNWMVWKIQIKHLLLRDKLWGYVDGTIKCKASPSDAEQSAYDSKCQEALTAIVLSLASNTVPIIQACEHPNEAWTALTQRFEASTLAAKLHLRKRYFRLDMAEGGNVERHLTEMQDLTDRLAAMGSKISEEDKAMTLLGSLPPSYRALVTTLGNQAGKLSVTTVTNAILDEQRRGGFSGVSDPDSALVGVSRRSSAHRHHKHRNNFLPRKCYNCGQTGHISRECTLSHNTHDRDRPRALIHKSRNPHSGKPRGGRHHSQAKVATEVCEDDFMFCVTSDDDELDDTDWAVDSMFCVRPDDSRGDDTDWVIDSGATSHMSNDIELFSTYKALSPGKTVKIGDGNCIPVDGVGSIKMTMRLRDGKLNEVTLPRVLHVPKLSNNLLSVRVITNRGHQVTFVDDECSMSTKAGQLIAYGEKRGSLYYVFGSADKVDQDEKVHLTQDDDLELWHRRLGHINDQLIQKMANPATASGISIGEGTGRSFCESCVKGKAVRKSLKPLGGIRSTRPLGIVHTDVCGPMQTATSSGKRYMITFTDDFTRMCAVYLMARKSEALDKFMEFQASAVGQLGHDIGILHSDNGGENTPPPPPHPSTTLPA